MRVKREVFGLNLRNCSTDRSGEAAKETWKAQTAEEEKSQERVGSWKPSEGASCLQEETKR